MKQKTIFQLLDGGISRAGYSGGNCGVGITGVLMAIGMIQPLTTAPSQLPADTQLNNSLDSSFEITDISRDSSSLDGVYHGEDRSSSLNTRYMVS